MKILKLFERACLDRYYKKEKEPIYILDYFNTNKKTPIDITRYISFYRDLTRLEKKIFIKAEGNVLDIGTANGYFPTLITSIKADETNKVVGIELTNIINIGKEKILASDCKKKPILLKGDFFQIRKDTTNIVPKEYDTITILDNTIGIFNQEQILREIHYLLKKHGKAYIIKKVPLSGKKEQFKIKMEYKGKISDDYLEITILPYKEFKELAEKIGFTSRLIDRDSNGYELIELTKK